jgi:NAD+ diphosphatase
MTFVPGAVAPDVLSGHPRWFLVHPAGLIVRLVSQGAELPKLGDVVALGLDPEQAQYLGRSAGEDCFALNAAQLEPSAPFSVQGLRGLHDKLDEATFALAGRAIQIVNFAETHRFCGRCGQPTLKDPIERSVRCSACDLSFYPRIAPAIIVLVRRGDEALLARSARFASGFYSTLAGFVEPGESLEQTLAREVFEEVGVRVDQVRYFGSQPWPFPHSLMVGFMARHAGGDIKVDGVEITDARWFSATALPPVPPKLSIARQLIDAWVAEVSAGPRGAAQ